MTLYFRSKSPKKSMSSPTKHYYGKSPYVPESPPKKRHSRRNSFPVEESSPLKGPTPKTFKRPPKVNHGKPKWVGLELSQERRASDVRYSFNLGGFLIINHHIRH